MSFTKLRAGGFGANTSLTSAELTMLDADHANALDKTGDTVPAASTIAWASTSTCAFASGSTLSTATGSTATFAGSSTFQNDVLVNTNARIFVGGITLQSQTGVDSTIANVNLKTTGTGRIVMGSNDYPTLGSGHTGLSQKVLVPFADLTVTGAGWVVTDGAFGNGIAGPGNTSAGRLALPALWNGAVIANIDLLFVPPSGHGSLPTSGPTASLQFRTPTVGAPSGSWFTLGSAASYTLGTLADWNSTNIKRLTLTPGSPTIDRTANVYSLAITDENGGGAVPGTGTGCVYLGAIITYTIADLRPA